MINNVVLMGRLVATPELRSTGTGKSVASLRLAVDRDFVRAGEQRQADFIDCIAWGTTAEFITRYFQKGSMIAVTGNIQTRNYEDKNGNKRKAVEVVVDTASFCGSKAESGSVGGYSAPAAPVAPAPSFASGSESDFEEITEDDDLPF